ncbi:Spy/CpxP family protein refolding chaperone [Sulfurovum mangrovi]|uniref:Spy/CpxP family protein refolding chaperone n=1 Tax=Sulfurovum mangrovi TaxID=2893889 RepID=UPI001E4A0A1F|nr:Spy/CpxP family protein refolding chaperone [Sulfurovum mangrovi]UFH59445.1 Spy/CpxP family protein refolding chaperone [Sulfurovum mangrovi]
MKKTMIAMIATVGLSSTLMAMGPDMQPCQDSKGMHACQGYKNMKSCKYTKGKHHKKRDDLYRTLRQLDLTAAQKEELRAFRETQRAERKAMKEQRGKRQRNVDLSDFMSAEKFDKEAFKAAMKERMEQREKMREKRREAMMEKRAERMEKIFTILTPAQREKWIQLSKS